MNTTPRPRASLFLHPAALLAQRLAPQRCDAPEVPAPSGWYDSSRELRDGLIVVEAVPADELPR